jgi:hypothetical protein
MAQGKTDQYYKIEYSARKQHSKENLIYSRDGIADYYELFNKWYFNK